METLEEIRAEVARVYRDHLPARLDGLSLAEQEAMFDRITKTVLDEADQLAPEVWAAAIAEETVRLGQHPDYLATVADGAPDHGGAAHGPTRAARRPGRQVPCTGCADQAAITTNQGWDGNGTAAGSHP